MADTAIRRGALAPHGRSLRPAFGRFIGAGPVADQTAISPLVLAQIPGFLATFAVWLICRPHLGIDHDARIYMARALGDLYPGTIGRDPMFVHDGQSAFSAFPLIAKMIVGEIGPYAGAAVLALAGVSLWFFSMTVLASRLTQGRRLWAMLGFVAVLPAVYGGFSVFEFGEAFGVPRPFAEAGVLAGLAAFLAGRNWLALGLIAVGAVFHPIMAVAGFSAVLAVCVMEDRRWLALGALGAVVVIAAAWLGLPLAARLFQTVDSGWMEGIRLRNPYLLPSVWPAQAWGSTSVQAVTVLIAARFLEGRARRLWIAAICVAIGGIALTVGLGDLYPSQLILQLQPWRASWLMAVLAAASFGLCVIELWERQGTARVALAFLAIAWTAFEQPVAAMAAISLAAGLIEWDQRKGPIACSPLVIRAVWCLAGFCAIFLYTREFAPTLPFLAARPQGVALQAPALLVLDFQKLPLAWTIGLAFVAAQPWSPTRTAGWARVATALLAFGAVTIWGSVLASDLRRPARPDPALVRILAHEPGDVLWLGSDMDGWLTAGRANWVTELQGASIVFSRPQSLVWEARMRRLVSLGLERTEHVEPWKSSEVPPLVRASPEKLASLCAGPDAPVWVISDLIDPGARLPPSASVWRAPAPRYRVEPVGGAFVWRRVQAYAVTSCSQLRQITAPDLRPSETIADFPVA